MHSADDNALSTVAAGWSQGAWAEVYSSRIDEESEEWAPTPAGASPWSSWDVSLVEDRLIEIVMRNGMRSRVSFADGAYNDFGPVGPNGTVSEPTAIPIVETEVTSPTEWRLLLQWPAPPDMEPGGLSFSELMRPGDVFIWANWQGASIDNRERVSMSVNRNVPED